MTRTKRNISIKWLVLTPLAALLFLALTGLAAFSIYETTLVRRAQAKYKLSRPGYFDNRQNEKFLTLGIEIGDTIDQVKQKLPPYPARSITYTSKGPQGQTRTTLEHWLDHSVRTSLLGLQAEAVLIEIYAVTFDDAGRVIQLERTQIKDLGIKDHQKLLPDEPLP